jgi:hypothetical protein
VLFRRDADYIKLDIGEPPWQTRSLVPNAVRPSSASGRRRAQVACRAIAFHAGTPVERHTTREKCRTAAATPGLSGLLSLPSSLHVPGARERGMRYRPARTNGTGTRGRKITSSRSLREDRMTSRTSSHCATSANSGRTPVSNRSFDTDAQVRPCASRTRLVCAGQVQR